MRTGELDTWCRKSVFGSTNSIQDTRRLGERALEMKGQYEIIQAYAKQYRNQHVLVGDDTTRCLNAEVRRRFKGESLLVTKAVLRDEYRRLAYRVNLTIRSR